MTPQATISDSRRSDWIQSAPCAHCIVCGSDGQFIHVGQKDRLFGAEGTWNLKQCRNAECGLIWLDPMPLQEEIEKAYLQYYTHAAQNDSRPTGLLKHLDLLMRRGYQATRYRYDTASGLVRTLGKALYLRPIRRRETDADVRFLEAVSGGRLLDVGCGSGAWLLRMRELGWQVEGCDFDHNAVAAARQHGLRVASGSLEEQEFPDNSFDAITLSHVVEHLPDPVQTLKECARILKPRGKLVLLTPNGGSLSHRLFKEHWRGLEPPRHLHLFSMQSMRRVLAVAGFRRADVLPFIVTSVIYESILLRWGRTDFTEGAPRNWLAWGMTRLLKSLEFCLLTYSPSLGDCIIAVGTKE